MKEKKQTNILMSCVKDWRKNLGADTCKLSPTCKDCLGINHEVLETVQMTK